MTRVAFDDSMITQEATQNVDYLSLEWKDEDIWDTRKYIRRRRADLENYRRLENALWRAWAKQGRGLPYFPSRLIQWYNAAQGFAIQMILELTFLISVGIKIPI